jgi:hypothetical protein
MDGEYDARCIDEADVEEQQSLCFDARLDAAESGKGPGRWSEQDLRILGERVRDYLRKVARRAVAAFVAGGVERRDAELYVSQDLDQVAGETWTAPKAAKRERRPGG